MADYERSLLEILVAYYGSSSYEGAHGSFRGTPLEFRKAVRSLAKKKLITVSGGDVSRGIPPDAMVELTDDGWKFIDSL